jgi:ADP-ribosylglycohydrolase
MTEDQALGMMVGCAVGDAFGAPFEFKRPEEIMLRDIADDYTIGGAHNVSYGEWTDDTAMMLASAYAYANHGKDFGTRSYVFDIGGTTDTAIEDMTEERPYMGQDVDFASGNGSIMRVAPAIVANHNNIYRAVADSVASSLMTHGNEDTIRYITAFSSEMIRGKRLPENKTLRRWKINTSVGTGTIMHSYNVAWMADHLYGDDFLGAMK